MYNNYNDNSYGGSYGGQGKEQRHGQNYSSGELFSSAKVLSEAAQSVYNHEPGKVNKAKVAVAASNILGATGVDENKGFGMYVDKAADYLNKHDSSSDIATRGKSSHSSGGFGGSGGYGNKSGVNDRYGGGYGNNNESEYGSGRSGGGGYGNNNVVGYGGGRSGGGYGVDDRSKSGYGRYDGGYGDGRRLSDGYGAENLSSGGYGYGGRKSSEYRDGNRPSGGYGGRSGCGFGNERYGSGYGNESEELYGGGYGRDGRESRPNYGYNYNN
ncbi:unnamed protein product [Trifolium pratense]|uniref:Uncharacterized protein n=1 Tax=Trifolium pratense TaxID=57577 RepID=A0ACB0JW61_TRIPR|nr:unnamed protein product [Trifolium pratense]